GRALALTHAHLNRLLGNRLVREEADPHLAATPERSGDGASGGLDLARVHPAVGLRLQPELAEGNGVPGVRHPATLAAELLPVLRATWHQHGVTPTPPRSRPAGSCPA